MTREAFCDLADLQHVVCCELELKLLKSIEKEVENKRIKCNSIIEMFHSFLLAHV